MGQGLSMESLPHTRAASYVTHEEQELASSLLGLEGQKVCYLTFFLP